MTSDGAASPDDPEWVEQVLHRALERAEEEPEAVAPLDPGSQANPETEAHKDVLDTGVSGTPTTEVATKAATEVMSQAPTDGGPDHEIPEIRTLGGEEVVPDQVSLSAASGFEIDAAKQAPVASGFERRPQDDVDLLGGQADEQTQVNPRMRGFLEWGAVVLGALAVALLIKTFLMQAYFIPSTSMVPTLNTGDRILVNKVSYKLHDINRGDLVVFNRPPALTTGEDDLIKRVIALPGETIQIEDNQIFIDGLLLTEPYLPEDMVSMTRFSNTDNCAESGPTFCQLKDDVIWVMGDNRTSSQDSRAFGPVHIDLVVGRAFLRVWPLGEIGAL